MHGLLGCLPADVSGAARRGRPSAERGPDLPAPQRLRRAVVAQQEGGGLALRRAQQGAEGGQLRGEDGPQSARSTRVGVGGLTRATSGHQGPSPTKAEGAGQRDTGSGSEVPSPALSLALSWPACDLQSPVFSFLSGEGEWWASSPRQGSSRPGNHSKHLQAPQYGGAPMLTGTRASPRHLHTSEYCFPVARTFLFLPYCALQTTMAKA